MKEWMNSVVMVVLYMVAGLAFGHGLMVLIAGGSAELPLVIASWVAAVLLLIANYRRSRRR